MFNIKDGFMKKIFTSISMALCLMASYFTASAQTAQLSEADKETFKKEVLPVIFEQIKEQAGLDILGWARPNLTADFIESLPVFNAQSGLRADAVKEPLRMKPDSVTVNLAAIPGMEGAVQFLGANLSIQFENYSKIALPIEIQGITVEFELPSVINVKSSTLGNVAIITFTSSSDAAANKTEFSASLVIFPGEGNPEMKLFTASMVSDQTLQFGLAFGNEFRDLLKMFGAVLPPVDYMVDMDIQQMFMGSILCILYGIPTSTPEQKVPMGDAEVYIDIMGLLSGQGGFPLKAIGLTSYENAVANGWRKLWFNMEQKTTQDKVMTIDNYVYTSAEKTDSIFANSTIVTMSDYTSSLKLTDTKSAMQSVINRVVTELATEGKATWYKMLVESARDINGDGQMTDAEKVPVMDIEVSPYTSGTNAIAEINIKSYSYDETTGAPTMTEMNVNATADMTSEVIKVDVISAGAAAPIASSYFKSNAFGIVTSNDNIAVSNLKVTPVEGGIYVANSGKATYRIVNISGATIANGTISGDNAYIPTTSLAKGVYVIVVTENGVSQSVKFAR